MQVSVYNTLFVASRRNLYPNYLRKHTPSSPHNPPKKEKESTNIPIQNRGVISTLTDGVLFGAGSSIGHNIINKIVNQPPTSDIQQQQTQISPKQQENDGLKCELILERCFNYSGGVSPNQNEIENYCNKIFENKQIVERCLNK